MSDWRKRNARALLRDFQQHGLATDVRLTSYAGEDLRGEVFAAEENLTGADFRGADLSEARLSGVCLASADLSQARLIGARLDGADLTNADLTGADLDGASLIGADLTGANITGATWRRAKLTKAQVTPGPIPEGYGAAQPYVTPRLQLSVADYSVAALSWHPDGDLLALARGRDIEICDAGTGTALATLTGHAGAVTAVAYSPDGTRLATASSDRTARTWDPRTGTALATLTGHAAWVTAVAYSPDGTRLATASDDGTIRMTLVTSRMTRPPGRWRRRRKGHLRREGSLSNPLPADRGRAATSIAFSPDGRTLATGRDSGSVVLTPVDNDDAESLVYLIGLRDRDWAAIFGEHRYRLHGDPADRFWWTAGLCRFEPGELDGYGVERL
jgi:hypothetical protein